MAACPELAPRIDGLTLTKSKHALRMLREGYLYVLVERPPMLFWQAYYVRPSGHLQQFPVERPPSRKSPVVACARMASAAHAMLVSIEDADKVDNSYWLFTPDPLSKRKLDEYRVNAAKFADEGKMQRFSPRQWLQSQTGEGYALKPEVMAAYVLEFIAANSALPPVVVQPPLAGIRHSPSPLLAALDTQPFPPFSDPLRDAVEPLGSRLAGRAGQLQEITQTLSRTQGVALALYDPIGTTQELNAWRNQAMAGLEPWMQEKDANGISNEWKFVVASQWQEMRQDIREGRIKLAEEEVRQQHAAADAALEQRLSDELGLLSSTPEDAEAVINTVMASHRRLAEQSRTQAIARAGQRAADRLDEAEAQLDGSQHTILEAFAAKAAPWTERVSARSADHLAMLQSESLIKGLYAYDEQDWKQGWAFAKEVSLAMMGMEASEAGQALLDGWWKDTTMPESNLAWRVYGLNQQRLMADARQALAEAEAKASADSLPSFAAEAQKGAGVLGRVLKAFDEANRALLEIEQGYVDWFQRRRLGTLMGWYAQLGRAVFRVAQPNALDMHMQKVMVRSAQMRLGNFATQMRIEEHAAAGRRVNPAYVRGQVSRYIRQGLEKEFSKGAAGGFYQARFLLLASLVESVSLGLSVRKLPKDSREAAEILAAAMALSAGTLELVRQGAAWLGERYSQGAVTARSSAVWGGRLQLYGGFLAGCAGVIGVWLDYRDAKYEFQVKNNWLMLAYSSRALLIGAASVLSAVVAFAGSAAYLKYAMERSTWGVMRTALSYANRWSTWLAGNSRLLASFRVWGARLGWAGLALTVVIMVLTPDAYKRWCQKSVFRRNKQADGYKDMGEELAALYAVVKTED
ncbi:hypothetical protein CO611_09010 [Lysobacteraceae bacterium NML03-0222]|nr:hypothetical protein CO611_09010 [Xanthomonadaceae bacterium NML03-0222]